MTPPLETDWRLRAFVYREFVRRAQAPSIESIAREFDLTREAARSSLRRLHQAHALFLRSRSDEILMANPFSAVASDYAVTIGEMRYYANCAWDSLGIPAAMALDARISARHPLDGELMRYGVKAGELIGETDGVVHFAVPFRRWYDDLVDT